MKLIVPAHATKILIFSVAAVNILDVVQNATRYNRAAAGAKPSAERCTALIEPGIFNKLKN